MFTDGSGFVKQRRSVLEHLYDGRMTPMQFLIHSMLVLMADAKTGVCRVSADKLVAYSGEQLKKRTVQDALAALEASGYIKREVIPGKHGNYATCVDKYEVTVGPNTGKRVSVVLTQQGSKPVFEPENDRTEENAGRATETKVSAVAKASCRTDAVLTPYRDRTDAVPVQDTRHKTKEETESKDTVSGGGSASQVQSTNPVQRSEIDTLIEGLYDLANKNPVHSQKNQAKAGEILEGNQVEYLLSLIRFCKQEKFWKTAFPTKAYPVNFFAKSLASIAEQYAASRPKQRKTSMSVQAGQTTATPRTGCSYGCQGTGKIFSKILGKELACACTKVA